MLWECQNVRISWKEAINRADTELNSEIPTEPTGFIWVHVTIATALPHAPPSPTCTQSSSDLVKKPTKLK